MLGGSSDRTVMESIEGEYRRYHRMGERAIAQLEDAEIADGGPSENSVAVIVWHVSGNLRSRFTDFVTSDGEKPWRDRDSEFAPRTVTREQALARWRDGWAVLFAALAPLRDPDLSRTVTIRGQGLTVLEALHRSLAHAAYHVGQIVYRGKALRGEAWEYLSIPPGRSEEYNRNPTRERAPRRER